MSSPARVTNHAMPPRDNAILGELANVTVPSSQTRRKEALSERLEAHRRVLGRAWFWELNEYETITLRKLKETLQTIFEIAVSGQRVKPGDFLPYVEATIALKMTYDEKNARSEKLINKIMSCIFGNPYVAKIAYAGGVFGVTVSAIAFGWSVYYDSGPGLITFLALGIIFGVVGGAGGLSSNALEKYYESIKVTEQDIRIQEAFRKFTSCYLKHDYDGCSLVLDELPVEDALLITNENVIRTIIEYKKNEYDNRSLSYSGTGRKAIPLHRIPTAHSEPGSRSSHLHDSDIVEIEEDNSSDDLEVGQADPFSFTDLANILHSFIDKQRHQTQALAESAETDASLPGSPNADSADAHLSSSSEGDTALQIYSHESDELHDPDNIV